MAKKKRQGTRGQRARRMAIAFAGALGALLAVAFIVVGVARRQAHAAA